MPCPCIFGLATLEGLCIICYSGNQLMHRCSHGKEKVPTTCLIKESLSNIVNGLDPTSEASGWELALVTAPSSNGSAVTESKLAGGLDFLQYLVFEDAYKSQLSIIILDDIERIASMVLKYY